mmetsp:Transcript_23859/g.51117  ORF Transcript_23859/g.51117 Transcript_23859/m.51117 type:complete len:243 (+) Transcript_23859:1074-1802(+)
MLFGRRGAHPVVAVLLPVQQIARAHTDPLDLGVLLRDLHRQVLRGFHVVRVGRQGKVQEPQQHPLVPRVILDQELVSHPIAVHQNDLFLLAPRTRAAEGLGNSLDGVPHEPSGGTKHPRHRERVPQANQDGVAILDEALHLPFALHPQHRAFHLVDQNHILLQALGQAILPRADHRSDPMLPPRQLPRHQPPRLPRRAKHHELPHIATMATIATSRDVLPLPVPTLFSSLLFSLSHRRRRRT